MANEGRGFVLFGFPILLLYCYCYGTACTKAMNEKNTRSECEQMQKKSLLVMLTHASDRHAQLHVWSHVGLQHHSSYMVQTQ